MFPLRYSFPIFFRIGVGSKTLRIVLGLPLFLAGIVDSRAAISRSNCALSLRIPFKAISAGLIGSIGFLLGIASNLPRSIARTNAPFFTKGLIPGLASLLPVSTHPPDNDASVGGISHFLRVCLAKVFLIRKDIKYHGSRQVNFWFTLVHDCSLIGDKKTQVSLDFNYLSTFH